MSGKAGASWCYERGLHSWVAVGGGLERCRNCLTTRDVLFTAVVVDRFAARDALDDWNRAEYEAGDGCSDGEADLRCHRVES
jgi:hypothetical protein